MLAIRLHRWRTGGPRWRTNAVRIAALLSAVGCIVGGLLLRWLARFGTFHGLRFPWRGPCCRSSATILQARR